MVERDPGAEPDNEQRALAPSETLGEKDGEHDACGDIHRVANERPDGPSVSIHVYGANIGAVQRLRFDPDGRPTPFVSGYSNDFVPNLRDRALPEP